jgi:hypothetical protein
LLENVEISGSVVLENTTITGVSDRIERSLIGRDVELRGHERRPRGYTMVLGDHSKLQMP